MQQVKFQGRPPTTKEAHIYIISHDEIEKHNARESL